MILLILHLCSLESMGYPFLLVKGGDKSGWISGMESIFRKPSDKLTERSIYANENEKIRLKKKGDSDASKQ